MPAVGFAHEWDVSRVVVSHCATLELVVGVGLCLIIASVTVRPAFLHHPSLCLRTAFRSWTRSRDGEEGCGGSAVGRGERTDP